MDLDSHAAVRLYCNAPARSFAKVGESAILVREIAKECYDADLVVTSLVDGENLTWRTNLTSTLQGTLLWIQRLSCVFASKYEMSVREKKGKLPNLRSQSSHMRESKPGDAWIVCTWWANVEDQIRQLYADTHPNNPAKFDDIKLTFLRGSRNCSTCSRRMSELCSRR